MCQQKVLVIIKGMQVLLLMISNVSYVVKLAIKNMNAKIVWIQKGVRCVKLCYKNATATNTIQDNQNGHHTDDSTRLIFRASVNDNKDMLY